jgi:Domain of unknown function (DUF3597)
MKVLDLDSSLSARKQLAQELHYTGDTNDSAAMNIWLRPNSLLTGKLTGNFAESGSLLRFRRPVRE